MASIAKKRNSHRRETLAFLDFFLRFVTVTAPLYYRPWLALLNGPLYYRHWPALLNGYSVITGTGR